jgi:uncharacterized protein (TIGR00369 family)
MPPARPIDLHPPAGHPAGMDLPHFPHSGSPFHDHLGVHVAEWRDGYAKLICDPVAHHANRSGIVHGGVLLSMIDQAAAFAGLYCPVPGRVRRAVTLDLDCRFTGQAQLGRRLSAEARVMTAGRNVFFARTEVFGSEGTLIAFGASTHRYRAGSGDPQGVPDGTG